MIEGVHALHRLMQLRHVARVAAISVGASRVGRRNQSGIRHRSTFIVHPISPQLDVVYLANWDVIKVDHVATDVRKQPLFAEKEATTGDAMLQGDALNGKALVLVYHLLHGCVNGMEHHFKLNAAAKEV